MADNPANRAGREETEAVAFGKLLRTVVAYVEFGQIALVVVVGHAAREAEHVVGEVCCGVLPVVALQKYHGAQVVQPEAARIVDVVLQVEVVVGRVAAYWCSYHVVGIECHGLIVGFFSGTRGWGGLIYVEKTRGCELRC